MNTMNRKFAATFCFVLLIGVNVQGMSPLGNGRCSCKGVGSDRFNVKNIKKIELFPPNTNCPNMEIIATMKSGAEFCLNPNSKRVLTIISAIRKKRSST